MAKYLVTGGAGFIGSNIARELVGRGEEVVIVDDYSTGRFNNLAGIIDKVRIIEGDICSRYLARTAMQGVDYVLHQAALPSVARSVANPLAANRVQVDGTINLLWTACQEGVKRFVYAGSSSVYGDSEVLPKREDMTPAPKSPYAVGKLAAEHYCKVFHGIYGLPTVVLRYFNVFGPRQDPSSRYSAIIPLLINAALGDGEVTIFGDGTQSRDFTYVANVVQANLMAVSAESAVGRTMNIACGQRASLLDLIETISEITGGEIRVKNADIRPGDVRHSMADIGLAAETLGYKPVVGLKEGLEKTIEFFKSRRSQPSL